MEPDLDRQSKCDEEFNREIYLSSPSTIIVYVSVAFGMMFDRFDTPMHCKDLWLSIFFNGADFTSMAIVRLPSLEGQS